ncbi:hypothetical protein DRQ36_07060, partial [bacterium]
RPGWWPDSVLDYIVTDPTDTLEFTLEPHTGAIIGTVEPPETECIVHAINGSDTVWTDTTDATGAFELTHLWAGNWTIVALPSSPDYAETSLDTTIAESETIEVVIDLEPATILREWSDFTGDDYGPGTYTYPTDPVFVEGAFDILNVRIKDFTEVGQIEFEIEIGDLPPSEIVDWAPYYPPMNLQKIDIYIDAHGGGSSQGLPNRCANFVPTDYWDWAISVDGWWVGMFASNGQSVFDGYTQNVTDLTVNGDTASNLISIRIDKSAFSDHLGLADWSSFENWDFIVLSMGHDGNGVEGIRWVNAGSPSQWNFGGGAESDIDPNIIDISVSAGIDPGTGEPKEPAEPQEWQLDYTAQTPVELSAHLPIDITPPVIEYDVSNGLIHLESTLHLLVRATITDDIEPTEARLYYSIGGDWDSVAMGPTEDATIWFGDIPIDGPIDSTDAIATSLAFFFTARDDAGNSAVFPDDGDSTIPPEYPFAVESANPTRRIEPPTSAEYFSKVFTAGYGSADTLVFDAPSGDRIAIARADLPDFPAVPCTVKINYPSITGKAGDLAELSAVRREITISGVNESLPVNLRLHWLKERTAGWENKRLSLCEFAGAIPEPRPYGGTYYDKASIISGEILLGSGLWAVGRDLRGIDDEGVLRNIRFSPNPFSPNGDGVFDEVAISWETQFSGSMDIDIYDINGRHIIRLKRDMTVSAGKSDNIWWDGKTESGTAAKAGIYAVRFELTFINASGVEQRLRENRPLVVIK